MHNNDIPGLIKAKWSPDTIDTLNFLGGPLTNLIPGWI